MIYKRISIILFCIGFKLYIWVLGYANMIPKKIYINKYIIINLK